ncbi:MAG: ankyrin repeat domain-containing protein [Treponema sp.]
MKKTYFVLTAFLLLFSSCSKELKSALKMPGTQDYSKSSYTTDVKANEFSSDFYKACAFGTVKDVSKLIKKGASVNELDSQGYSPLFYAVLGGNPAAYAECIEKLKTAIIKDSDADVYEALDCVPPVRSNTKVAEYLLKNGANIQLKDRQDRQVFIYAALFSNDVKILSVLKKSGANIHDTITIQHPSSLLSIACMTNPNPEVIDFLCKEGGNIHEQNKFGTTPIMWAAMYTESPEVITTLKKNGADINDPRHKDGYTPLIWSVRCNRNPEITGTLCKLGADLEKTDNYDWNALDWSLLTGPSYKWNEKLKNLENRILDYNSFSTMKQYAALKEEGKHEHLKVLLTYCSDDDLKKDALEAACFSSDDNFYALVNSIHNLDISGNVLAAELPDIYILLIAFDDAEKLTYIHSKLKNQGSAVNDTALQLYYAFLAESKKTARYLIPEVSEMLIDHQSVILAKCTDTELLELFSAAPFINIHQKDSYGRTVLYSACENNNYNACKIFIEKGADVNTTCSTQKSRTPLLQQCYMSHPSQDIVKLLLENGARVNVKDEDGVSPLIAACYSHKNDTAIRMLIKYGADKAEKYQGKSAYQYCNSTIKNNYPETYRVLYNAGNGGWW